MVHYKLCAHQCGAEPPEAVAITHEWSVFNLLYLRPSPDLTDEASQLA